MGQCYRQSMLQIQTFRLYHKSFSSFPSSIPKTIEKLKDPWFKDNLKKIFKPTEYDSKHYGDFLLETVLPNYKKGVIDYHLHNSCKKLFQCEDKETIKEIDVCLCNFLEYYKNSYDIKELLCGDLDKIAAAYRFTLMPKKLNNTVPKIITGKNNVAKKCNRQHPKDRKVKLAWAKVVTDIKNSKKAFKMLKFCSESEYRFALKKFADK